MSSCILNTALFTSSLEALPFTALTTSSHRLLGRPISLHRDLDHAADALIVAGLIKQDQEIGLDRDLEQQAGILPNCSPILRPISAPSPLMRYSITAA